MKKCSHCSAEYSISRQELELLSQLAPEFDGQLCTLTEPEHCPVCRLQNRLAWRGELNLFHRKSGYSKKPIITFYPPESPCRIYSPQEYWSDSWDPRDYGQEFDFNRPFFEQFAELLRRSPVLSLTNSNNQNCEYINCSAWCKDCYLLAGANHNEHCLYGNYINYCSYCVDNNFIDRSELCYECVDCSNCYNTKYSTNCQNCSDSYFLHGCRGCSSCFASVNLANKQYVYFNKQLSKADYLSKIEQHQLHRRSEVQKLQLVFEKHRLKYPHRFMIGVMNQNVTGNTASSCKNTHDSFDVSNLEDCSHCAWFHESRQSMDCFAWGMSAELCYQCMEVGEDSYRVLFSATAFGCRNVLYSYCAHYSSNCFGCVGTKRNEYLVLNKQYSKDDFDPLVLKIIEHMRSTGEWGKFFPISLSPLPYNVAVTDDYFPIEPQAAKGLGWNWSEADDSVASAKSGMEIPDSIDDADDSICKEVFSCSASGKPFKFIRPELDFYRKSRIPLPDASWKSRHKKRLTRRCPRQLWERRCAECKKDIRTSYAPYMPEIVVCESCYQGAVS